MSVSISASTFGSTYKITVGTTATFTNAGSIDISSHLNSEIAAAPAGDNIVIDFEPGSYGVGDPILLPSNTSVVGDDSTLTYMPGVNPNTNWGMLVNADDYAGAPSAVSNDIVDTNISVVGMSFVTNNADIFGTWFINAKNIDVQNNVYVSGRDGNAFVSVINGIVANNVAFGMDNAAYDNWNGPVNVTIEDNSGYVYGNVSSGWNVLLNSSIAYIDYSGDAAQYGISVGDDYNDAAVDNTFSTNWAGSGDVDADALLDHGYTTEANMTQQGNVYQGLGVANSDIADVGSPMTNSVVEDESFVGLSQTGYGAAVVNEADANTPTNENVNPQVIGNLVLGLNSQNVEAVIWNAGLNPTTENNADIDENLASTIVNTDNDGTTIQSAGNIINTGSTTSGSGVIPSLDVAKPATFSAPVYSAILISGLEIKDITGSSTVSATLTTTFGTLSLPSGTVNVDYTSIVGEPAVVLTGSLSDVNDELGEISYTSNAAGWDDAIKINVLDSAGFSATSYIPVTVGAFGVGDYNGVLTFTPGEILPELDAATVPEVSTLSLDTVVGVTGNNVIQMGTTVSIVFLDAGSDTIIGGPNDAYITTGQSNADIQLSGGGNASISGGSGPTTVNAATGNNVVASGSSNTLFVGGPGANTVAGGLGNLTVQGGAGSLYLATLPQDGGDLTANLGSGNSTVFALSGNDYVETQSNTENFVDLGIGNDCVASAGADVILTGAGSETIDASAGGSDSIVAGSGSLYFVAGAGNSIIAPAAQSTIVAGTGNLTIGGGGRVDLLQITPMPGTSRVLTLDYVAPEIPLIGYGTDPIAAQSQTGDMLNVTLSDGTLIKFFDPGYLAGAVISGTLGLVPWSDISAPDVVNLDDMLENTPSSSAEDNQIIQMALSEIPSGETGIFYTGLSSPGGLVNNGTLVLDPTNLILDNPLTGEGVIDIDTGSNLGINGSVASTQTIAFTGTIGSLMLGDPGQFFGTITGFDGYNKLDLSDETFSANGFATLTPGNILDVVENGRTTSIQLDPLQSYAGNVFSLASDGLNGTSIADATNFRVPDGATSLFVGAPVAETIIGNGIDGFQGTFAQASTVNFNSDGGSGSIAANGENDLVAVSGGSWTVVGSSNGSDTINAASSNAEISTSGADNVLGLAATQADIASEGSNDLIASFGGTDMVSVADSANIIMDGGAATIDALAGSSNVNAFFGSPEGGGLITFINNSVSAATVSGSSSAVADAGSVTVYGGLGGGYYEGGGGGGNVLLGGTLANSGNCTLIGQGVGNLLDVSQGSNALFAAAGGQSTLDAGPLTSNNIIVGGGNDVLESEGTGFQAFFPDPTDTETINGSAAEGAVNRIILIQTAGGGTDYINGFRFGTDEIYINPVGYTTDSGVSVNGFYANAGPGGGTCVELTDGTLLKVIGVNLTATQESAIINAGGQLI